jgi:hypothetical protein
MISFSFIIFAILQVCYSLADYYELALSSYKGEQYYGEITINDKSYNVVFDTGSNIFWVKGTNSTVVECIDYEDCKNKCYKVDSYKSTTVYFIKYGTGFVGITSAHGNLTLFNDKTNILINQEIGNSIFEDRNIFSQVNFKLMVDAF